MFKYFLFLFLTISSLPISASSSIMKVETQNQSARVKKTYTFGTQSPDHDLLAVNSGVEYYPGYNPTELSKVIKYYPRNKIIEYVRLDVIQDTNEGIAYISLGGIGGRKIEITLKAYNTIYLEFECNFFGRKG